MSETPEHTGNIILTMTLEMRLWLENMMKTPVTNNQIWKKFEQEFPWFKGLTTQAVAAYRKRYAPEYRELLLQRFGQKTERTPEFDESEILDEISEEEEDESEFSKDEQQKLNMIKAHRKLLKEAYDNYKKVKNSKDETAKKNFLELCSKLLGTIKELESSEKSFLTALDEVRKAESKESIQQSFDSLTAFFIPRMSEKCKDRGEVMEYLFRLQMFCQDYAKLILDSKDAQEANKTLLDRIYRIKKIKEEEIKDGN